MLSIQVWGTKVFVTDFYTKYLILVIFLNIYHYFGSTSHVFHNFHYNLQSKCLIYCIYDVLAVYIFCVVMSAMVY